MLLLSLTCYVRCLTPFSEKEVKQSKIGHVLVRHHENNINIVFCELLYRFQYD
jgi:hypothetical protein